MLILARFDALWVIALVVALICPISVTAEDRTLENIYSASHLSPAEPLPKRLTIINSKAWKPYSFIDDEGAPAGILVDMWTSFGQANDIDIEFKLVDWQASLDLVKNGLADIHSGLMWSESRANYLTYGAELFSIDTQLYFHETLQSFDADLFLQGNHGYEVGVVTGGYESEYMQTHFPNVSLKRYDNNALMINAALKGQLVAFVSDLQVANYYLHTSGVKGRFIDVKHLYSGEVRYAIGHPRADALLPVMTKFEEAPPNERERILSRWMHITTVYPSNMPTVVLTVMCVLAGIYLVLLRLAVRAKTQLLAQDNRRLKHLSETDALTGLWNRRYFLDHLENYAQLDFNLTVMIIDIDDFKQINDTYGHIRGDLVIKSVSEKLNQLCDESHTVARIGGEEFALATTGLTYQSSAKLADDICHSVRQIALEEFNYHHITVSVGCVVYERASDFETLYEADRLMYMAKRRGKNQVATEYLGAQEAITQIAK